jgi:hypothetical protein
MATCLRESAMDTVDESVGLVELPPQLGALPAMKRCPAHRDTRITLGFYPLQLAGYLNEVFLQRPQHLPSLRC